MECPFTRWLPKVAEPGMEAWWAVRWKLLWPLHRRLWCSRWTIGEVLILPVLVGAGVWAAAAWEDRSGSGTPADVAGFLAFATAMRNSALTLLIGLPFERALFYHKICGVSSVILGCYHGYINLALPGPYGSVPIAEWAWIDGEQNITGLIVVCGFAAACLVAFYLIRRHNFEVFHRGHILFALAVFLPALLHGAWITAAGAGAWLGDLTLFYLTAISGEHDARTSEATAMTLPAGIIRVSFPRGSFKYCGGQYCFLCVKALGPQFHPFSFSSSPHDDIVTLHIRVSGNWTKNLYDHVSKLESRVQGERPARLQIYFDGPYGASALDLHSPRYTTFVLVSGGIGITPMQSIYSDLLHQHTAGRPLKKLLFMWAVADKHMLGAMGSAVAKLSAKKARRENMAMPCPEQNKKNCDLPLSFQPPLNPMSKHATVLGSTSDAGGSNPAWQQVDATIGGGKSPAQPSGVSDGSKALECSAEFYLTRVHDAAELADAGIDADMQQHVILGQRPDFDLKLSEAAARAKAAGESRVAVLVCGPAALVDSVRRSCVKASSSAVVLDFHAEVFEF